jgi:beta-1,2-mannobiose phosphorylase / 1,2-beta-oligomannan phosphorylase
MSASITNSLFKLKKVIFRAFRTNKVSESPTLSTRQKNKQELNRLFSKILTEELTKSAIVASNLEVENFFITPEGVKVFFHCVHDKQLKVYLHLLELANIKHALWKKPKYIATIGDASDEWQFQQLTEITSQYLATWVSPLWGKKKTKYPKYLIKNEIELKHKPHVLYKPVSNPMLEPNAANSWEAFCTFNPAAIYAADKVHLLYRAQGHDYVSQIGYASSENGLTINERLNEPAYRPSQKFEGVTMPLGNPSNGFVSGGGCGGCEDPRATIIDDRVYMTYVAYDGWNPPRVALTSIALDDFLDHNFLWEKPVLISQPGEVNKSAVIFPEKINNKYVIMHRVFPNILIDFVDDLNFDGYTYLQGQYKIPPRSPEWWDSRKVGAGAPPLKTKDGWLLIYQAVDDKDASEYKVGAMLLDLEDPTKVLCRSSKPILEPRETYENYGFKAGVVYPCGAVIKDNNLFVYYGGADSYVCVATAPLDEFLENLKTTGSTHLTPSMLGSEMAA